MEFSLLRARLCSLAISVGLILGTVATAAESGPVPELVKLRAKAEAGEAEAQRRLGQQYEATHDHAAAAKWYRLAAEQGDADAQVALGDYLLTGRNQAFTSQIAVAADKPQAILWYRRAANRNSAAAMQRLGQGHLNGTGVPVDKLEAYKWLKLSADRGNSMAKIYLDQLILKLSSAEIAQAQKRADQFVPGREEPDPLARLVLSGITGNASNRLALLNGRTFAVGETQTIKLEGQALKLTCIEIGERFVRLKIDGRPEPHELSFKP